jgi:3-deoxy-D-manno-octulosonic-acid transferase
MRLLYTLAWLAALPFVAAYLLWRSRRQPEYRRHWAERFLGTGARPPQRGFAVWMHAVSLGETRAAQPLLEELARQYPHACFVLTHMTPTGREAGAQLLAREALRGRAVQRYLPYDLPWAVARFLRETRPRAGLLMETEIWPNLLAGAARAGVPVALVNARLSPRSLARARRQQSLLRGVAARIRLVCAQTPADAQRIAAIYPGPVHVTGNLKFDQQPDGAMVERGRALRRSLGEAVFVRLFASTREGEEELLLGASAGAGPPAPGRATLSVIVPRHPQRFGEVAALLAAHALPFERRSALVAGAEAGGLAALAQRGGWLLGDSMGEMALYYALADAAFIGGSLQPLGGQNLIEACACACPVVVGPHTFNFAQATEDAIEAGAALRVADAAHACAALGRLAQDGALRESMAGSALAFAAQHRGATLRTLEALRAVLDRAQLHARDHE